MSLTVEQRIQKAHIYLMRQPDYALYSGVFMLGKVVIDDTPTAKMNGRDVNYGRKFVEGLDDKELRFLILHENMHKAFRHLDTWKNLFVEDAELASVACDVVINNMLVEGDTAREHIRFIEGGVRMPEYRGLSAGQVYAKLKQDGEGGKGQQSLDEHDFDDAQEIPAKEQAALAKEIEQALRQGGILAGKLGGKMNREVQDLLTPQINWREALAEFIKSTTQGKDRSTWRRPNRRWVAEDVYLPSLEAEACGRLCFAIDTSGSIGTDLLSTFATELAALCRETKPASIDIVWWDASVAGVQEFAAHETDQIVGALKPVGGGGTDANCVASWLQVSKQAYEAVIVLTDGYYGSQTKWADVATPSLWCITSQVVSEVGQTIRIEE